MTFVVTRSLHITFITCLSIPICCFITFFLADIAFECFLSLHPLYLSFVKKTQITNIRQQLAIDVQSVIEDFGPLVWSHFEQDRIVKKSELKWKSEAGESWLSLHDDGFWEKDLFKTL